ncbi:hypothetical protein CkaCkLH20_00550 [Colletotrichum karsti]|uniref:Rhodopsin domain-containing protein n=1 Tax=Colletotrichum karsti TaxID=1095194 RepID=A0A9P6IGI9_9PEZI|nr:uncharacterized protein CkaCkLH20_00550 [Colletotrichum karsti]KAF9882514.1 hypothetical protein CkaCkLH20_00550 [Colletotrichum karsti]
MTVTKITTAWLNKRAYITEDTNNTNIGFFNFVTYEILYAVVSVMTFIDLLTLLLRIASVRERRSRPQADDYSAILACVFSIATGIIVLYGAVKRVTGRHDWDPWPPPEGPWPRSDYTMSTKDTDHPVFLDLYKIHLQVNYALNSLQGVGIGTVRLAFLFLFKKLFTHQGRGYMILVNVLIGFVTLFMLAYTAVSVFVCGAHPEAQWTNHDTAAEHCLVLPTYNFGIGIVTVVLDTAVFFLPMYPLYRITSTMTREKKCYILIVFCFGFLAVISSFFSLIIGTPAFLFQGQSYLYTWLRDHGAGDGDTFDFTLHLSTMPPKKTTEAGASTGNSDCTDSEIKLMIAIMELMTRPSLDYDALALKLGSASANAARMRVSAAVNKHPTWFTGAGAATNEDGTPVKKTRAKRTPKKKAPSDEDENAEEQDTPSQKKARTGKAKPKTKVEEDVAEEDIKQEGLKQEVADGMEVQV